MLILAYRRHIDRKEAEPVPFVWNGETMTIEEATDRGLFSIVDVLVRPEGDTIYYHAIVRPQMNRCRTCHGSGWISTLEPHGEKTTSPCGDCLEHAVCPHCGLDLTARCWACGWDQNDAFRHAL